MCTVQSGGRTRYFTDEGSRVEYHEGEERRVHAVAHLDAAGAVVRKERLDAEGGVVAKWVAGDGVDLAAWEREHGREEGEGEQGEQEHEEEEEQEEERWGGKEDTPSQSSEVAGIHFHDSQPEGEGEGESGDGEALLGGLGDKSKLPPLPSVKV